MSLRKKQFNTDSAPRQGNEEDIILDIKYIRESCALIAKALKNGCDIIQMPNGEIVITELKAVTIQYIWDDEKGKLVRGPHTHKLPKAITNKSKAPKSTEASNKSLMKMIEFA